MISLNFVTVRIRTKAQSSSRPVVLAALEHPGVTMPAAVAIASTAVAHQRRGVLALPRKRLQGSYVRFTVPFEWRRIHARRRGSQARQIDEKHMRTSDFTYRVTASIAFRDQQPLVGNTPARCPDQ
jgi:hypothetical protein